jgi:hypothetical protein
MTALKGWGDSDEDQACLRVAIRPIYAAGARTWASAFATWRLGLGSDWIVYSEWKMARQRMRIDLLSNLAEPHRRLVQRRETYPSKGREHRPPVQMTFPAQSRRSPTGPSRLTLASIAWVGWCQSHWVTIHCPLTSSKTAESFGSC